MKKIALVALFASVVVTGCGGGDSGNDAPAPGPAPAPAPAPAPPAPAPAPLSEAVDRGATQWLIQRTESPLDGSKTTKLIAPGPDGADFVITCKAGIATYGIKTDFVTGSGLVSYRVGSDEVKTETWLETSNFQGLIPQTINKSIYKKLYQNFDFVTRLHKYSTGMVDISYRIIGFPAAVDKSREDCGWSLTELPPSNGWPDALPDTPPTNAVSATYTPNVTQQFGVIGWKATSSVGNKALLVRVGGDKALCKGSFVIGADHFYVVQNGKKVPASPGFNLKLSCPTQLPVTLPLQGDFNADEPLELLTYPFYTRMSDDLLPISRLSLN